MRILKKPLTLLLCFTFCALFLLSTRAQTPPETELMPLYNHLKKATVTLSVSGGKATVQLSCQGSGVTKITAKTSIQKKSGSSWSRIDLGNSDDYWHDTVNSIYLSKSHTKALSAKGTYRGRTVFTLTGTSGDTEKVTKYSSQVTY